MTTDRWNGNGDWTGNPTDWSAGAPPASTGAVQVQTGTDSLSTAATVKLITVDSGATLAFGKGASLTTSAGIDNAGDLSVANGSLSVDGILTNSRAVDIAGGATARVAMFDNTGSLNLTGYYKEIDNSLVPVQGTMDITGVAPTIVTGSISVSVVADLELSSGITTVALGGSLGVEGADARISLGSGTTNTALSTLSLNEGTASFGGTVVTTKAGLTNIGTLLVATAFDEGKTSMTFGGALTNLGRVTIGGQNLGGAAVVTATALVNDGSLHLEGNISAGATTQATLDLTGASGTTVTGALQVSGDADLEFSSGGFTTIGFSSSLELDGSQARASIGAGTTSTALSKLSTNFGTLELRGNTNNFAASGAGGASLATVAFTNYGTLGVDAYDDDAGDGGSRLTIGGVLTNVGGIVIGSSALSAATTVTATGLNNSGTLSVLGNATSGTKNLATLDVSGASQASVTGTVQVSGDADLEFTSSGFTGIAGASTLELDGSQARVSLGAATTDTALSKLSTNAGTLLLRGNSDLGAGGVSLTTTVGFTNDGTLDVDSNGNDGGSKLSIGGVLTNFGTVDIGDASSGSSTSVSATGLVNDATLVVQGNHTNGTTLLTTLNISGASPTSVIGSVRVSGDADLAFASSGLSTIAAASTLELDGAQARISVGLGTTSTALSKLSSNAGTLSLQGDTSSGGGGSALTTTVGLTNSNALRVDTDGSSGGSKLTIGGSLVNLGTTDIGNLSSAAPTLVMATSLGNSGTLVVQGNDTSGTKDLATLDITGASPASATGDIQVAGDADLEFASGGFASIAAGSMLELDGSQARVSLGAATTSTALSKLASNAGTLFLEGNTGSGAGGASVTTTTSFTNSNILTVDNDGNSGGSKLTIGGGLTNFGEMTIGNSSLSAATTVTVNGLYNAGALVIAGNATDLAELVVNGSMIDIGTLTIGTATKLDVTGNGFTQNAGTTTVAGTLVATTITAAGGLLDFTGAVANANGTGTLNIGADGRLEFDAAVGTAHKVDFTTAAGTLALGAAQTFAAPIAGFTGNDVIDLLDATVIGLSYAGTSTSGVLTLTETGGMTAKLAMTGKYTTASFTRTSDGHGGTDILDLPALATDKWNANGSWTANPTDWSTHVVPGSSSLTEIQTGGASLSTTATVKQVTIDAGANLNLNAANSALTTTAGVNNAGYLSMVSSGDKLSVAGTLTNSGTIAVGGANQTAAASVTAGRFDNTGTLDLEGSASGSALSTMKIAASAPTIVTGAISVSGDADLEVSTGLTALASGTSLELTGSGARISIGAATTSTALSKLATNAGTLRLHGNSGSGSGGNSVTTSVALANSGLLAVDAYNVEGGSALTIGGALTNSGTIDIGNSYLVASTIVKAAGLTNGGTLFVSGNGTSGTTHLATLDITGAAPTSVTGSWQLGGDADVAFASGGISSIAAKSSLELDGAQARVSLGATTTSTGLSKLSSNAGALLLRGNSGFGSGGASVTTTVGFINSGTLELDNGHGDGGSKLTVGGVLTNVGTTTVGNLYLAASTIATATGLSNSGVLYLQGNNTSGTKDQATLDITGVSPSSVTGSVQVAGDADLEFASGGLLSIAAGSSLQLDGAQARVSLGAGTTSTALSKLSSNAGTLVLSGGTYEGSGGVSVTTSVGFNNTGGLYVDASQGEGGSKLTVGGVVTNFGTVDIGSIYLSASTTVAATGLISTGSVSLQGNNASGTKDQATLDITGASPTTVTGSLQVGGDADLEFASSGISTIAAKSSLEVDGSEARISIGAATTSTALSKLSTNLGSLTLLGNAIPGSGGASVTTSVGLTNVGSVTVDQATGNGGGGSKLTIGGVLTNLGTTTIGDFILAASTMVTATGLNNSGSLVVYGNGGIGSTDQATLDITGASPTSVTGSIQVGGDADLEFASGGLTSIAAFSRLELDGAQARISLGAATTSTALSKLATNAGTLVLRGNGDFTTGGAPKTSGAGVTTTIGLSNSGTIDVDNGLFDGGSKLTIGGTLTNLGTIAIGNSALAAATTVTATGLSNSGTLSVTGDASSLTELAVSGNAIDTGALTIGASTKLDLTGSSIFTQSADTTTVAGTLVATTINASGGLLDFTGAVANGDGTGALTIGGAGTLEFDAAVGTAHKVSFSAATGTLELRAAQTFAATIAGFTGSDAIDLLNTEVTSLAYAGTTTSGVLTITETGGASAKLAFTGDYTTASFTTTSDGNSGTEILDPPVATSSTDAHHAAFAQALFEAALGPSGTGTALDWAHSGSRSALDQLTAAHGETHAKFG